MLFFLSLLSLSQAANLVRLAAAPALMIGSWRILGSALIMLALRYYQTKKTQQKFIEPMSRSVWIWTFLSGTFFFLHLWTFFFAAQHTTIANCMVLFAINPIFTAIGSWLWLKDRFQKRYGVVFVLAFCGIYLMASSSLSWENGISGDLSALLSAAFFSVYLLASKKSRLHISTEQFTGIMYLWTAFLFFAFCLSSQISLLDYPAITWWAILGNILIPTLLGHVMFTHLLKYFNINWMSCGKLLEPAMSAIVAFFVFGESLKPDTIIAFFFFAASVVILLGPQLVSALKSTKPSQAN